MKNTNYLLIILTAGVLALAGCGKSSDSAPPPPVGMLDFGGLQKAFPTPTPEITASLEKIRFSTRYRQYDVALMELDKIAQTPDLTEEQKKVVNAAIEQVKVAISKLPAPPSQ